MSASAQTLYQDVILEHCKRPRNRRVPVGTHQRARGENPLCGDHIDVYLRLEDGRVQDLAFDGVGCAVATASASLMTEAVTGMDRAQAQRLLERFEHMLCTPDCAPDPDLGPLRALHGVHDFPGRLQCASLAWDALRAALRAGTAPDSQDVAAHIAS